MLFKNIVLDWSGTLVDDLGVVVEATNKVMSHYGAATFDRESFKKSFYLPYDEWYREVLPQAPCEELEDIFRKSFDSTKVPVIPLAGSDDFLKWAKNRGIRLFILSSVHEGEFREQCRQFGWFEYFEEIYAGVVHKIEKLGDILQNHGLKPEHTAFVGDMTHDIETGNQNQVTSVGLWGGYQRADQLAEVGAKMLFPNIKGFHEALMQLPERPIPTVGAMIKNKKGEYLIVKTHKWSDKWGIPGGKIEKGESAEDALRRELMEETNQSLGDLKFVMAQDCIDSKEFFKPEHFILLNYEAEVSEKAPVILNDEAEDFKWLSLPKILELDLNQPTRVLVENLLT